MGVISQPLLQALKYLKLMWWLSHNFTMMHWAMSDSCISNYSEQPNQYWSGAKGARNPARTYELLEASGYCFTNVSRALQNNLAKIHITGNHIYGENFKLKLCTCAQSHAKFQLEILIRTKISAIHKFQENILESSQNVSETTPRELSSEISREVCVCSLLT